jgi:molybdenum cofactor guanylyltransferase
VIFHGFVQSGGGSTRFGTDKALAKFAGKSILQRTGQLLARVCDDVTVVTTSGHYPDSPWPVLADRWPGEGPLGGILTALSSIRAINANDLSRSSHDGSCPFAIILSCDMPFLTAEFLQFLIDRAKASEAQVVVPKHSGRLEPLCACWCAASAEAVQRAFDSGVRKVSEAMKQLPMEVLDESAWKRFDSHNRLFWNMNTPEDYETARRILENGNR